MTNVHHHRHLSFHIHHSGPSVAVTPIAVADSAETCVTMVLAALELWAKSRDVATDHGWFGELVYRRECAPYDMSAGGIVLLERRYGELR